MLSISHALTGACIARFLPEPALYTPLTLAAHYLEDWIPHWDVGTGLSSGKRRKSTAIVLEIGELIITVGLIYWFAKPLSGWHQLHVWTAALVALMPDFLEAPRNFLKWEPEILKPFNNFHGMFHHSTRNMIVGLTPQLILVAVIFWLR